MHFVCISAANIRHARHHSTSIKVCHLIKEILTEKHIGPLTCDIIPLVDYELKPCHGCGTCYKQEVCPSDPACDQHRK